MKFKIMIFTLLWIGSSSLCARVKVFSLESKVNKTNLSFSLKEKKLIFSSSSYNAEVPYSKCSSLAVDRFLKKIIDINNKTISLKGKGLVAVNINGSNKNISNKSKFGKLIHNLPSKLMTLKKEVRLSCKK